MESERERRRAADRVCCLLTSLSFYHLCLDRHQKQYYSKKYGVHLARFTHKSTDIIHASTKEDGEFAYFATFCSITTLTKDDTGRVDVIRYLSLHDNIYLRYFKGHKKRFVPFHISRLLPVASRH